MDRHTDTEISRHTDTEISRHTDTEISSQPLVAKDTQHTQQPLETMQRSFDARK